MTPTTVTAPAPTALRLEPWRGLAAFEALADTWDALVARADLDPLCNSAAWIADHVAAYSDPATAFGWVARDADGEPVAAFAFRHEPSRGALRARRALLAQDGSFESDYLGLPVVPGAEPAAIRALVDALDAERGVDAVVLHAVDAASPALAALDAELARRGRAARREDVPCAVAELPATFDEFLAGLKKRMRSKVRQAVRRADEAGATYRWCDDPGEFRDELAGLYRLHQARWEASGGSGSFADERRRAFYDRFAPRHLAEGTLRLGRMDLDGVPVAYQIGLVAGDRYYQLQEGYLPEHEELRVATALRAWGLERMLEDGVRHYDFMAGASRHKSDWGGEDRPCALVAFPTSLRGRLEFALRDLVRRRDDE